MSETAANGQPQLPLGPLPATELSPAVAKLMAAPSSAKLMAAKGIAPLRPAELVIAVYQLTFDADAAVKQAAEAAVGNLPDKIIAPVLGEELPAQVLHLFAQRLSPNRVQPMERILYNQGTRDETFVALASRLHERELEIIIQNEERLLRCPAIVQTLYFNPGTRMSSLNRAIELLARNNVRVEGIPSYDEVAKSIMADPAATQPVADAQFQAALQVPDQPLPEIPAEEGAAEAEAPKPEPEPEKKSAVIEFGKLKLHEKIRLATLGNAYCRSNLIRDSNKMVAMAVIRSPMITDSEVVRAAGNRQICEDVIRYIANQREFVKMYQVRHALVLNPKCPLAFSLRFLPLLQNDDIKTLARSKNVPSALATAARKLVQTRKLSGG